VTLPRRLAAICYDALLLTGVLFVASFPVVIRHGGASVTPGNPYYLTYLLVISYGYFALGWIRGGQTLGMKSWRIRLRSDDGGAIGYRRALSRFLGAIVSWLVFGLGYVWSLCDHRHRCWHDRWSRTSLIHEPRASTAAVQQQQSAGRDQ
jgi:uncharacterized RDD family membrane protein YckC